MATDNDVVERIRLAPDAGLVHSLGANHTLESAIADLVDNCVDAGAGHVAVRLLSRDGLLTQVEVLDNGRGMGKLAVNAAMTIGHQRKYISSDLGHFGMGLKAASFGHAKVLTVWSQAAGKPAVGRRIRVADFSQDFSCEVLSPEAADHSAQARALVTGVTRGTSIVWTDVKTGYRGSNEDERIAWLSDARDSLASHLGVVFHRLLAAEKLRIELAVEEVEHADRALGMPVGAIDPFGYQSSGHPAYPKELVAEVAGDKVAMTCHIWPPKANITGFRIGGRRGTDFQGFFIYRNDRLLSAGGWAGTANEAPARQLARVVLDDPEAIGKFVTMNPEKHGLRFEQAFHDAVATTVGEDGTTFARYLADAEFIHTESRKRERQRKPAIRPAKGFDPKLKQVIREELPMIEDEQLDLRWKSLPQGEFIDIDFPTRTVWINKAYRHLFAPERGSLNDAPVMKALLYLLTHTVFEGAYLGVRDKDEIALWSAVLGEAAEIENSVRGGT